MPISVRSACSALLAAALLAVCASLAPVAAREKAAVAAPAAGAEAWLADVTAISSAADNAGRRAAIESALAASGLKAERKPFAIDKREGVNLFADVGGPADAPLLLIGAHSDKVEAGRGATDNASGSAAVLALAQRLKQRPLQHHRVRVAFWDLEELGLLGSRAYVADGKDKPALYVNFDVFGWGDALWMQTLDEAHPLVAASRSATETSGIALNAGKAYPPTDHLAFQKAGWPAVSYSLVGRSEISGILDEFAGKKVDPAPKVMQVIHSDNDTLAQLDATEAAKGVDAVEAALRVWDADSR
ncbi:M28 family metallopeptidase [Luteimonas gilva]|nr:M20/M25/M40 family metallo-hydrolase [Luteimonas gilva]